MGYVKAVFGAVDPVWSDKCHLSGLASGEGLIWAVRDPIERKEPIKQRGRITDYQTVVADHGASDKRALFFEGELSSVLRVLAREGNTLSAMVRCAWDTGDLQTATKNSPAKATGAHISIVGHATKIELMRDLSQTESANGFGNRFLWICTKRSKLLPDGGAVPGDQLLALAKRLEDLLPFAREERRLRRDEEAKELWHRVYPELSEGKPGLMGAMVARAEAQVTRLSLLYALLDQSSVIRTPHLRAALEVWRYSEASARFVFGNALGDPGGRRDPRSPEGEPRRSDPHGDPRPLRPTPVAQAHRRTAGNSPGAGARAVGEGADQGPAGRTAGLPSTLRPKRPKPPPDRSVEGSP